MNKRKLQKKKKENIFWATELYIDLSLLLNPIQDNFHMEKFILDNKNKRHDHDSQGELANQYILNSNTCSLFSHAISILINQG